VEADPAVLNLGVFETFFPEKRPFFLEDSRIFVLPYGQAPDFYSRRIGQAPQFIALKDDETLVHQPDQTTILGAAKLTGKRSGWTYGGLAALTSREFGMVDTTTTAADGTESTVRNNHRLVEPETLYTVGRVQRDIMQSSSNVGFVATGVVRGDKQLDAFTGGPDYNIRWDKNRYNLNGHLIGTHAPIDGVERDGFGDITNININGKYLNLFGHYDHFGRNFRNSDLGFLGSRVNKNELNAGGNVAQPDPTKYFRSANVYFSYDRAWNADGLTFWHSANVETFVRFLNYWWIDAGINHDLARFDDLDTRGGPPIVKPAGSALYFNVSTDTRKTWSLFFHVNANHDRAGGWEHTFGPSLKLQPSNWLQASLNLNYTSARDAAQWIENTDLDGDGVDENIYGTLRRHVVNLTGRATYAFGSDMTLEAYLQPFVAVGRYADIRKLARAKSFDFEPATASDDPDFNRKSLRGTIVMRWEYMRGSTLFLVWNTATLDESRVGQFSPMRDLGSGFTAPGTNVFVVKISYWFTP
jgi:Domain of unknown function (DUF5916)